MKRGWILSLWGMGCFFIAPPALPFARLWIAPHGPLRLEAMPPPNFAVYDQTEFEHITLTRFVQILLAQYQIWDTVTKHEVTFMYKGLTQTSITAKRVETGKEGGIDNTHTHQVIRSGWNTTYGLSKTAIAVTLIYSEEGVIKDADIVYNDEQYDFCEDITTCPFGHIHLPSVARHEIGHQLGFDHSRHTNSNMYAHIAVQEEKNLTQDERDGATCTYARHISDRATYIHACASSENEGPLAASDTILSSLKYTCSTTLSPDDTDSHPPWMLIFLGTLALLCAMSSARINVRNQKE